MKHLLLRDLADRVGAALPRALGILVASEGLIVAGFVGIGAGEVWPGSGLFAFGTALYVPLIIDRVRGA
jgi:hypothetical protein